MDKYLLLRFAHLVGLMLMSAGLIGVFVADMRSRQVREVTLFAQAVTFIAVFYDGLVVPGALLLAASGTWLIVEYHGGWSWAFLSTPWLAGMVLLFALEFVEGNTITRLYFMRLRRLTRIAVAQGRVTEELARARGEQLASFTHYLDIPLLLVIVSLGALRPADWTQFVVATGAAVIAATVLNTAIPRLYPLEWRSWARLKRCQVRARNQPFSTRPATASSFFKSSGSRASGAVISAVSSARSEPMGHGSCSRGKSFASRATSVFAFSALLVSTLMMSCTVTASWSGCQQSKSVTIATVA